MAHTPGPWDCDGTEVYAEHLPICTAYRARLDDEGNYMPNEEVNANARLIAAAPELLVALREALEVMGGWGDDGDPAWASRASAAIAKAEGRE